MDGLEPVALQRGGWKVAEIERHDRVGAGVNGHGGDVSIIGIGKLDGPIRCS